ncbi:hypothetical protein HWV62_29386 [Athelia sp. TMB]|nr:hypothetical protein HWV62_29386 [Athelia sp. TMB]
MFKTQINAAKAATFQLSERAVAKSLPAFTITRSRGFLPREDPVQKLPAAFAPIESLLDRMTIHANGKQNSGLLATGQFGDAVHHELKGLNLEQKIDEAILSNDQMMISALFRDYAFLTSAYVLEPVDLEFRKSGVYTTGRSVLPRELAVPMKKLADALGHFPFMEYASVYALQNWARKDPAGGISYDNLRLLRAFENHEGSEKGFILVHVDMVANSGKLISAAEDAITAAVAEDRPAFNAALEQLYVAYQAINLSMETMWGRSKPADYIKFRSFIFGTAPKEGNPMFPNGVVYEGVDEKPLYFRGESGANDSMIPLGDNLLEITASLPENELTSVLREFRAYRPPTQREYIAGVEARARLAGIKKFAEADPKSLALYVLNVDQIREFRQRHWSFTKEYIIRRSSYGIATGGSPILRYLPSNLATVTNVLAEACAQLPSTESALHNAGLSEGLAEAVEKCRKRAEVQKRVLEAEMAVWEIVGDQKRHEAERTAAAGVSKEAEKTATGGEVPRAGKADLGEEKILQRGWVGNDGVG